MPASCRLINGKWRVVDKGGLVKNSKGTAVDGSGHENENSCKKQARAINANKIAASQAIAYSGQEDLEPFCLSEGLLYEKELIYAGEFEKDGVEFELREPDLLLMAGETTRMIGAGVDVFLPLEHTNDPEKNRGYVRSVEVKENSKGIPAIYGQVEFRDEEAAKLAKSTNVSIYAPPKVKDGKGNEYVRPIRHVALTNQPVIPGLDDFTPIAASFITPDTEGDIMSLKTLADKIGLKLSETDSEDVVKEAIEASFTSLSEEVSTLKQKVKDLQPKDPVRISKAQRAMLLENRELKLSRLVEAGKIVPAVADELKQIFCKTDNLDLVLSEDHEDNFDAVIRSLVENETVLSFTEKSGPQIVGLPKDDDGNEVNPLVRIAEKMNKKN